MSVCRTARLARVRPTYLKASSSRRLASSGSDHHDHHDHHSDGVEYPKEGFSTPFWRNTVLFVAIASGIAAFAPSGLLSPKGDEAPWITRVLAHYAPKPGLWLQTNERHLEQAEEKANYNHVVQFAKRPQVHRYKYPLSFEQGSTHRVPVGGMTDLSDLEVKNNDV